MVKALNVKLDIDGEVIGEVTIVRRRTAGHKAFYSYEYESNRGPAKGYVWHQLKDSAAVLAAKVLEEADKSIEGVV